MRPIPLKIRKQLAEDPNMKVCIYTSEDAPNHDCGGRITFEHAIVYSGRQVTDAWATVPCCENHNSGRAMVKTYNRLRALEKATPEDLAKYPRVDWEQEKRFLKSKFSR